jgi:hypothetical protein
MQKKQEQEQEKTLLDVIADRLVNSSNMFVSLVKETLALAKEVKKLKETVTSLIQAVQIQQTFIDELMELHDNSSSSSATKNINSTLVSKKNDKNEKPN